ncbi:hypothetical protein N7471_011426 [Penicillium samsonianum]|uniref:uncharacterized protein n=1 Tax=Penicillium samsonianum TaxID=1882272 RepID=UPI002547FE74|nr:uncharacterized protein N7471_011426 [Penicillium samsonianum]KAJ6124109.1 hypothetical protein N7471_011426 [Penicillium samsonianum]
MDALSRSLKVRALELELEGLNPGPSRSRVLEQLAELCSDQYEAVNKWKSLEDALKYLGELIESTSDDDFQNTARLSLSYSRCLRSRFMRGRHPDDLRHAIEFATNSVMQIGHLAEEENKPLLVEGGVNLLLCLFTKVNQLHESTEEDFDNMVNAARDVEDSVREDGLEDMLRLQVMNVLGLVYQIKWERDQEIDDLVRSLAWGRQIIEYLSSHGQPSDRALSNLAFRLQRAYLCYLRDSEVLPKFGISDGEQLLNQALEYLEASFSLHGGRLLSGAEDALTFVSYIKSFPIGRRRSILGRCYKILRFSLNRLRELCRVSSQEDQQDNISTFYGLSRYTAAASLEADDNPYEALLLLEEGRGIAIASQYEDVQDTALVCSSDEMLGRRFVEARNAINSIVDSTASFQGGVERLSKENILDLAEGRDIALVNVTDIRSDAIIISKGEIKSVYLADLDEDQLAEESWEIQTRLAETDIDVFYDLHQLLSTYFRDLWKKLAKPVLDNLGHEKSVLSSDTWPHICWIPTGILCLYPIHAAGLGLHKDSNVMNRVISSYALSLRSLFRNHERYKKLNSMDKPDIKEGISALSSIDIAVVSMPETPDRQPLTLSEKEADYIKNLFPKSQVLIGETTQAVLEAIMKEPKVVHFSCHGEVDYDRPLLSKFLTRDWKENPLNISRLQTLDIGKSELAFLSACFTANAGVENLQDEHVHLAAVLQLAGFLNVVGSAWYVGEEAGLEVTKRFYERLGQDQRDWATTTVEALHFAVRDFRETTRTAANRMRGDPVIWAPFLHYGF